MARIRSIHPGQWTDGAFLSCSVYARMLAIALRNEADDQGVFVWQPVDLKVRLMPVDAVDVPALLAELEAADLIRRYTHAGRDYGVIRNFRKYQRPKKPKHVHFMPEAFRPYIALTDARPEPGEDDDADGPQEGEHGPQREEEGGRRENRKEPDGSSGGARRERQPAAHLSRDWQPDAVQRDYAAKLGLLSADIAREAVKFVGYFTDGRGAGERRNERGWRQSWQRWAGSAAKNLPPAPRQGEAEPVAGSRAYYERYPHLKPSW